MAISYLLRAALWMFGAMVSFSVMAISGRELAPELNTFEIMFLRTSVFLLVPCCFYRVEPQPQFMCLDRRE